MLEMQAAIGRIQLRRLPEWRDRRNENARRLADVCRGHDVVRVPAVPRDCIHAYYRFNFFVRPEYLAAGWSRDRIVEAIVDSGVPCYHGACPEIYLERAFEGTGCRPPAPLKVAKELGETSMMLLVHPTLTTAEIDTTCSVLDAVLTQAGR